MNTPSHAAWLEPHLAVAKPDGEGPFPVSLQFHGCGGIFAISSSSATNSAFATI